jgi:hypothetical protein
MAPAPIPSCRSRLMLRRDTNGRFLTIIGKSNGYCITLHSGRLKAVDLGHILDSFVTF